MAGGVGAWVEKVRKHLAAGWMRAKWAASQPVYAVVSSAALWSVLEALAAGDPAKIFPALMTVTSGVGGNLVADQLKRWKDDPDVTQGTVTEWIRQELTSTPGVRKELDLINETLGTIAQARSAEGEERWAKLAERLSAELVMFGSLPRFQASISGPMTIVQRGRVNIVAKGRATVKVIESKRRRRSGDRGLTAYFEYRASEREYINLGVVDPHETDFDAPTRRPRLAEIYVHLRTDSPADGRERGRSVKSPADLSRESQYLTALEAAARDDRLVILGDPGSGKSTFLSHLVFCLARHRLDPGGRWLERLPGWPNDLSDLVPVPIVLTDLDAWLPRENTHPGAGDVQKFIENELEHAGLRSAGSQIFRALEAGKAIVLLDGLDEVNSVEGRQRTAEAVRAFAGLYKESRVLATCRVRSYQPPAAPDEPDLRLPGFRATTLAVLDTTSIHAFIDAWYSTRERLGAIGLGEAASKAMSLLAAIEEQDLGELAANPLLLTVMAQVHAHRGQLPTSRAKLYEWVINLLMFQWEQAKGSRAGRPSALLGLLRGAGLNEGDLLRTLREVAFTAHKTHGASSRLADISEEALRKSIASMGAKRDPNWTQAVLDAIRERAGLLVERVRGIYTFPHGTFQEYLAGSYLSTQNDFAVHASSLLEGPTAGRWDVPVVLAVGRLVHEVGDTDKPLALLGQLCPEKVKDSAEAWHKTWVAGEALVEMGVSRAAESIHGEELLARVRLRLRQLVERGRLSAVARVAAGNALGKLGDPRFLEGAWFLPDDDLLGFVEIPAAPFVMGSPRSEKRRFDDEFKEHEVEMPRYYLARYPVTVAQFKAFVDGKPFEREDSDWRQGLANHPVVSISWHEALAYCDWLTEQLRASDKTPRALADLLHGRTPDKRKWRVTLPSEAEWEKAARGPAPSRRVYPWGDEPDPDAANYDATGIGATSPVGCFPKGASQPYGVLDLAGNAWEWTRNLWGKDVMKSDLPDRYVPGGAAENLKASDDVPRVLRGGAFNDDAWFVRCAVRFRDHPNYRLRSVGFRVAVSPFVSDP
jgi:formylglycine-generating enzyme required for sulfatase activity